MKNKLYTAIGLMSGTSMDGVDVSLIRSDGLDQFVNILDEYYEYDTNLHDQLVDLRNVIFNIKDLETYSQKLIELEREITLFHSKIVNEVSLKYKDEVNFVGFHGQTIFHNPELKISRQLGDGELMSQLIKKHVVYDFRQEDLKNNGQGAPLAPIFHNLLSKKINEKHHVDYPICFINIGGISNITKVNKKDEWLEENLEAFDSGPGNCMIDEWIRKNSKYKFDQNGSIAKSGKINQLTLNQAIDNFNIGTFEKSLDIKDFDISFVRGLSLEDGAATLTHFTARLIGSGLINFMFKSYAPRMEVLSNATCLVCGGGRKNNTLINQIKQDVQKKKLIIKNISA